MDISPNVKLAIMDQERQGWLNTRYQLQLRHRVNTSIGSDPAILKQIETELMRCEQAIDILTKEMEIVENELRNNTIPNESESPNKDGGHIGIQRESSRPE
jgi:hypothetical protein